jgi:hypothetical protein
MFDTQRLAAQIADAPPILIDQRLHRFPVRQDALLKNLFEVRQLGGGVRAGFSCWEEEGVVIYGHVVFDQANHLRSMHLVDKNSLTSLRRRGDIVWNRPLEVEQDNALLASPETPIVYEPTIATTMPDLLR